MVYVGVRVVLLSIVVVVLVGTLPPTVAAQSTSPSHTIKIDFAGPADSDCVDAINFAPHIDARGFGSDDFGPPLLFDSGNASGNPAECGMFNGAGLELRFSRRVTRVEFNRAGTVRVQGFRTGEMVLDDETSGLGGIAEYALGAGIDRLVIQEATGLRSGATYIDDLSITFPQTAVAHLITFDDATDCENAFANHYLGAPTIDGTSSIETTPDMDGDHCFLAPNTTLTLMLPEPAIALRVDVVGIVEVAVSRFELVASRTIPVDGLRPYIVIEPGSHFYLIEITAGTDGAHIDNLLLSYEIGGGWQDVTLELQPDGSVRAEFDVASVVLLDLVGAAAWVTVEARYGNVEMFMVRPTISPYIITHADIITAIQITPVDPAQPIDIVRFAALTRSAE